MTADSSFSVSGKRVVVVGAARSGVAAAELLVRRGATRHAHRHARGDRRRRASCASAGVDAGARRPPSRDAARRGPDRAEPRRAADAAGDRRRRAPRACRSWASWSSRRAGCAAAIVAITGTKGKSTTTTLTGRMLEAGGHHVLVGGNIGLALSAQVDDSTEDTIHVVEASSFQLESADTFHPWIAVLLNFSPDHLDRHADIAEYAAAKARIFANQTAGDWAVLNADDEASQAIAQDARSRGCCSRSSGSCRKASSWPATPSSADRPAASRSWCRCRRSSCSAGTCWRMSRRPRPWRRSPASSRRR